MKKKNPPKKRRKSSKKSSKKPPTPSAAAATDPSHKTKPKPETAPTAEPSTPTPKLTPSQEQAKQELEQIGKALGLDKLAEAVNNIGQAVKENREAINQLVGSAPDKAKKKGEGFDLEGILENPFIRGLLEAGRKWLMSEEGNPESKVDPRLMTRIIANEERLQEKRLVALDLLTENLTSGGKVFKDEKGNIVVTKG